MTAVKITGDIGVAFHTKAVALGAEAPQAVLRAANHAGGEIARQVFAKHGGGKGTLARSFLPAAFVDVPGSIAAGAFSDLVYAEVQDQGGTIRPKSGKNLAIPLTPQARNRWPRDWGDKLFFLKSKNGKGLLAERVGNGKKLKVQYVLQPQVTITGSGYIRAAAAVAAPVIGEIIATAVDKAMDK